MKIKRIVITALVLVATLAQAAAPDTLGNSTANLSPYKAQQGGLYLGSLFKLVVGKDTVLQSSTASWVDQSNNTIVTGKMPYVSGTVYAKDIDPDGSVFAVTTDKHYRYFNGNGLPSTPMGEFPVQAGTPAYTYYSAAPGGHDPRTGIPGSDYSSAAAIGVSPYHLEIQVPKNPQYSKTPNPINSLVTGVALTGTVWHIELANASSSNWYSPISILPLDQCWGHPYSQQYHIHGYSWKCFPDQGTEGHSPLFGYALDGFGIYGPRGDDSKEVTNKQLDECHGHVGKVMWDGMPREIYHYHLNSEFPYSIGCFRGRVNYIQALGKTTAHSGHGITPKSANAVSNRPFK